MSDWTEPIVEWLKGIIEDASANALHRASAECAIDWLQVGDPRSMFRAGEACEALSAFHRGRAVQ